MKVQNKFFMMSTSLILALVATSVHADEYDKLARREKRLATSAAKVRAGDESEMGRYAKRLRKVNDTRDDLGIRRVKSSDQRLFGIDPANSTSTSSSTTMTVTTTTVTFSGDGSVNVSNSGNPGQGNTAVKNEPFDLPANGQCGYGFYPVPEIGKCVPASELKDGPCDTKGNSNPGQGNPGQGNPGQGNPGQGNALNCSADPNSIPNADKTACVCKDGYEVDPTTKLCAKPEVKQSCEDQGKITDPDTGECLDVPPPPKPVVNPKPVRTKPVVKKPVVKKPEVKKPIVKKPEVKKPVVKKPEVKKPEVKSPCDVDPCTVKLMEKDKELLKKDNELLTQKIVNQQQIDSLKTINTAILQQNEKDAPKFGVKTTDKQEFKAGYWKGNSVIGGSVDKINMSRKTKIKGQMTATTYDKVTTTLDRSRQNFSDSVIVIQKQYGIIPVTSSSAK